MQLLTCLSCTGPIAVKALVLTLVERLHANGWGMLYDGLPGDVTQVSTFQPQPSVPPQRRSEGLEYHRRIKNLPESSVSPSPQVAYIVATIVALDYLHDSWFYWTHRWLHSRLLYKHIHAIHHM